MNLRTQRTTSENEQFVKLVRELDAALADVNGEANSFFVQFNKIDLLKHVVVVYLHNEPVGCGAIKEYEPGTMEVKRMYVPPRHRGKGIATHVLTELEQWARELGYQKCILETTLQMHDAVALYKKNHYTTIPNYGQYKNVATSVCFQKVLG